MEDMEKTVGYGKHNDAGYADKYKSRKKRIKTRE